MADVTGGVPPTNASPFDVPGDIAAVYDHFGDQAKYSVANAASLPASNNWVGRRLIAADTGIPYICTALPGTWVRDFPVYSQAAGTHTISTVGTTGGSAPIFWSGVQTVSFPASRFTVAPIVTVANVETSGAVYLAPQVVSVSTTQFTYRAFRIDTFPAVGAVTHWHAVQMLSGAAAG